MEKKVFTRDDILSDANRQMAQLSEADTIRVIPEDVRRKSLHISMHEARAERYKAKVQKIEDDIDEALAEATKLRKDLAEYLLEHPSGFFLWSSDKGEGTGIATYADFSEVGVEPEIPTGEEATEINRAITNRARNLRNLARKDAIAKLK